MNNKISQAKNLVRPISNVNSGEHYVALSHLDIKRKKIEITF